MHGHTHAVEVGRVMNGACLHRVVGVYFVDLGEGLVDENDGNQNGEAFLGEAGDVADHVTKVKSHNDQQNHHHPEAYPEAERRESYIVLPGLRCQWF